MSWFSSFSGVVQYEFRMQARRRSLWVALLGIGLLTVLVALPSRTGTDDAQALCIETSVARASVSWAVSVNTILPLVAGILLADRLPRDEMLRVNPLFRGLPLSSAARLLGKYVGATLATIMPIVLIFVIGVDYIVSTWRGLAPLPLALAAFTTINLPGLLFVAAFSLIVPLVMPVPVYQVLFTGYWFWGNLLSPTVFHIPTLSDTILTPIGQLRAGYFFGVEARFPVEPNPLLGLASIAALALCAAVALLAAHRFLRWQHARE